MDEQHGETTTKEPERVVLRKDREATAGSDGWSFLCDDLDTFFHTLTLAVIGLCGIAALLGMFSMVCIIICVVYYVVHITLYY